LPKWKIAGFIIERGVLLGFFALYVQAIRPEVISQHPSAATWAVALLGFALLFPVLTRLPESWPAKVHWTIRTAGWLGMTMLLALLRYPDGGGFSLSRSDIIIVVLANLALFGSLLWWLTRRNLLLRLGVLGILIAVRLSNMPHPLEGWVSDVWQWSPAPWIYKLYYLQYLFIFIPGTIVGELLQDAMRPATTGEPLSKPAQPWSRLRLTGIVFLMAALVATAVIGLKARWLVGTTLTVVLLCLLGSWLMRRPGQAMEHLVHRLFNWAIYWLVLGLCFEPYEGGIKKDRATMSYYFVTSGLAICVLILFIVLVDVLNRKRWLQLLIENGQNPMIAYAGINNLILPLLALSGLDPLLSRLTVSPWLGFLRGAFITLLLALTVSLFTRLKVFWRT
jgi:hypothetical protein